MTQPEALRLADWLDVRACGGSDWNAKMNAAAAELRRLAKAEDQRDALLEALRDIVFNDPYSQSSAGVIARAAIKAVEEGK
jgi:hypothetical protein